MIKNPQISRGLAVVVTACVACIGAVFAGEGEALGWLTMIVCLVAIFGVSVLPPLSDQIRSGFHRNAYVLANIQIIGSAAVFFFAKALA